MSIGSILKIIGAGFIGAVSVRLLPESWVIPVVLTAFGTCIIVVWILYFQSDDFEWSDLWGIFFDVPFKPSATIKKTLLFRALILLVSFAIGACASLIWTAHAQQAN